MDQLISGARVMVAIESEDHLMQEAHKFMAVQLSPTSNCMEQLCISYMIIYAVVSREVFMRDMIG